MTTTIRLALAGAVLLAASPAWALELTPAYGFVLTDMTVEEACEGNELHRVVDSAEIGRLSFYMTCYGYNVVHGETVYMMNWHDSTVFEEHFAERETVTTCGVDVDWEHERWFEADGTAIDVYLNCFNEPGPSSPPPPAAGVS